jgi:cytochrome c biogenesis protein CcmG/thiol:disulfide interchange protein DsbE
MSKTDQPKKKAISFEVEIESGGRAYRETETARETPVTLSPTRAAAKAKTRQRNATILLVGALLLAAAVAWAWFTNPFANVPSDAVARVNGTFIYQADVEKQLNFIKFLNELYSRTDTTEPNSTSILEDMIVDQLEIQDARKAGITATATEIDKATNSALTSAGHDMPQAEAMLAKHSLTLADMRTYSEGSLLIGKNRQRITAIARNESESQNLLNTWFQSLVDDSTVDRFKAPGAGPAPRVGAEAPDFTLKDLSGNEIKLSTLRGKPVMINFWATWCPPCREEIPVITKMYHETEGGTKYEILGVATSPFDTSTLKAFGDEFTMDFPLLPDVGSNVVNSYHVLPIPTTFFVDKDGIIRFIQAGGVTREMMEKWLLGD